MSAVITVTNRDTCKPAYIDPFHIEKITEHEDEISGRAYPWSRVHIRDGKQGHDYTLDVVESRERILELTRQALEKPDKPKKEE